MPADAHPARGPKSRAQVTRADAERSGDLAESERLTRALRELVHAQHQPGLRRRRGLRGRSFGSEATQFFQQQRQQQHREIRRALRLVGCDQLSREREQLRLEAKRLESQRRQRIGVRQLKRHKQPRQFRLLWFGVMVKLKRKHEQPFAGFQRDRAVIHAHRRAGPQRQHQHEPVMQRPAASRFVQVAGRPALEAHEVVGQNQRLGRATLQLVQRLG